MPNHNLGLNSFLSQYTKVKNSIFTSIDETLLENEEHSKKFCGNYCVDKDGRKHLKNIFDEVIEK